MNRLQVDFSQPLGKIKPLHGVNNGPVTNHFRYDATPWFRAAGIPFCRLHDTEYPLGGGEFIDIACIFKDFNADENDPASYNFALSDEYIRRIRSAGAQVMYRLGSSIEHQPIKRYIHPPADFSKWARICEHIIRHYNEGWADGHHWDIRYWEIWNEPDLDLEPKPRPEPPCMWTGTPQQFFELYFAAATHLKRCFPQLKIGGPGMTRPDGPYVEAFLKYITDAASPVPLDFFSWHGYVHTVEEAVRRARAARELLDAYGLQSAESVYNEWNYVRRWDHLAESFQLMRSSKGAALCAGVLCELQKAPVDMAMYYDAQMKWENEWCGLFSPDKSLALNCGNQVHVLKPYYSFEAFGRLYRLGTEVAVRTTGEGIYACAAIGSGEGAILISNYDDNCPREQAVRLEIAGSPARRLEIRCLNETLNMEKITEIDLPQKELTLTLPADSVQLLLLR